MFMIPLVTAFSIPADCNGVCWEASHEVVWTEGESFEMETVAFEEASLPGLSQLALTEQDDISMELISSKDKKETKKEKKEVKKQTKSKKSSQETAKKSKSSSKKTPKATAKKTNSSLSFIHQKNAAPHESSQADYQVPKAGR